ncbi:F-box/LRR-repeat LRR-repeat 15-like [Octopus vulgaris]|nr:F-box/LRR-repeat LRR-repeat 15-like [Octopus vulgaris]
MVANQPTSANFEKTFLDLPWQDVLWKQVLPYLSIKDLFSLRLVNSHCKRLAEGYFSSLKQLDISTVSDQITLTAFNIIIENTQNLTSLNLKNCTQCACEDTLVYLIERNPRLSKVSFKNCNALSDCVLLTLSTTCLHLTHLNLSHCTWLHNVGLVTIAFKCHSLKYLNISSCFNITDESIRILVFNCHKLTTLKFSGVYNITDYSIEMVSKACPELVHLDIQGCYRLTEACVKFIMTYCKSLQVLKAKNCQHISERCLLGLDESISVDVLHETLSRKKIPRITDQI